MADDKRAADDPGFTRVPDRYMTGDREVIDQIRDSMSDQEFGVWCRGQVIRYSMRVKDKEVDPEKSRFYQEMADHVFTGSPDPRHRRGDAFQPYKRASMPEPLPERRINVLDHGFVRFIEDWGGGVTRLPEAGIIEAARQSTQGSFRGWRRDASLLRYLHEHRHSTPFEFAGMTLEICAPIFVFREWHRHRTQCLHPDTMVEFERPCDGKAYPMRIEDVWRKWQPTARSARPQRQKNALGPRSRIQKMQVRCFDESAQNFVTTRVVDVIRNDPKPMVRVTVESGRSIIAAREHKFFTDVGWLTLGAAIERNAKLVLTGTKRGLAQDWTAPPLEPGEEWRSVVGWEGFYEVSSQGRVRRVGKSPRKLSRARTGYFVCSLNRPGVQTLHTVHRMVLEAFIGPGDGLEARHLNHNRADNRLVNLAWGTSAENSADMVKADRVQRLVPVVESIVSVEDVGDHVTYDIAVEGPWHNFSAQGFVVHNSYSEMSARYAPLPDFNYVPTWEEVYRRSHEVDQANKQAGRHEEAPAITEEEAQRFVRNLEGTYAAFDMDYKAALAAGVPKELARLGMPVGRYSQMRATANLRNWLGFLTLRLDPAAQWEIRQYAKAVHELVLERFPQTAALFNNVT